MYVRKIIIAVAALLVCAVLLVSVSFAWLSMSQAPEVSGMATHIGANGSLEMALLTPATYVDPSLIRTRVGDSMELGDFLQSNTSWGNMVDLSHEAYGLNQISIYPARLNARAGEEGLVYVGNNLLLFPEYSPDGRLETVNPNSVAAPYNGTEFHYSSESVGYGVRGIGTIPDISMQETALVNARVAVRSYGTSAVSAAKSIWKNNGHAWLSIYIRHYAEGNDTYTAADVEALESAATKLLSAVNYLDLALRQGVIGYAASLLDDEETFKTVRDTVENPSVPLSMIVSMGGVPLPSSLESRIQEIDQHKLALTMVIRQCNMMKGDSFTWAQIEPLVSGMIDGSKAYLNDRRLTSLAANPLGEDNVFSLIPDSGPFSAVAEYAGGYSVLFEYGDQTAVKTEVLTDGSEAYLQKLANLLDDLQISEDDEDQTVSAPLMDVYGYAVDMAFRCNAQESALLLQTTPTDRMESETDMVTNESMGSGSFMRFLSEEMSEEQLVAMMDAIRIGFIDNQNRLVALAKPGVLDYTATEEGGIQAPVFLYDFSVSENGCLTVGGRREASAPIVALEQSETTVLTIVVWLDGDSVDNRLASISQKSVSGDLNLQFSSSAALNSATGGR